MALRRSLAQRLFTVTKISSSPHLTSSPCSTRPLQTPILHEDPARKNSKREFMTGQDSTKNGFFRRFLQKREIMQPAVSSEFRHLQPIGDKLMENLKGMNLNRDRLRLEGLTPPMKTYPIEGISVQDARKLLILSQLEMLKSTLRRIPKSSISYTEFVQICKDGSSLNSDQGLEFAKRLDESGAVIVLGNVVFLQPEQVARAIEGVISLMPSAHDPNDTRMKELRKMEKEKEVIDMRAESLVRRELWCGLGLLVVQTVGFMRLTFWDLSWDIMEPVCFFVTSIYFIMGYFFFLRTSRDPSFEGFFERRFSAKQKRLMKMKKFDVERFRELQRACYPFSSESTPSTFSSSFNNSGRPELTYALDQ